MQTYRYYKELAKKSLQGNFIKCIVAFLFVSLLPVLNSALEMRFPDNTKLLTVISLISTVILVPCFKMGAIEYLFDTIRNNKPPLGNMFNGFKYILKLIPVGLARVISFAPFIIASIVFINIMPEETMNILTEYAKDTSNTEILKAITDEQFNTMYIMELIWIFTVIISVYLNTHLSLCEYILCNEKASGFSSVFKSIKMMKGYILYYIGFSLSFILWFMAAAFTGGISLIILHPYQQTAYIMFYMDRLLKDSEADIEINDDTIKEE
ncbi:MAG: DUF975 family protein [Ruminococcaceae bacterium]|nr:DUF975 family protein [Oscillospiraceae bacterium]